MRKFLWPLLAILVAISAVVVAYNVNTDSGGSMSGVGQGSPSRDSLGINPDAYRNLKLK